jgi:hypothetical protein
LLDMLSGWDVDWMIGCFVTDDLSFGQVLDLIDDMRNG